MTKKNGEKGQSAVEFALVLPILIIILCGIIDFGWLFSCEIAATNAAREAARYTAIHYYDSSIDDDLANAKSIVLEEAPQLSASSTTVTITSLDMDNDGIQESIQIDVSSPVSLFTGLTSALIGKDAITLSSTSIMKLE